MRLPHRLSLTGLCGRLIARLPTPYAVSVKERIRPTGRLDYSGAKIRMHVDSFVQLHRLGACAKEPETVRWIERSLHPGDVFYDIGANVGAYSFVADAVAGGDCRVYAFEAGVTTFAALSENVLLNGCQGRVIPLHVALAAETRLAPFRYSSLTPGAALHHLDPGGETGTAGFSQAILSYRLDDLVRQFGLELPTHMKLDVDGDEADVLVGAEETLTQAKLRSLLVEVDETRNAEVIYSLVVKKGFRVASRHHRGDSGQFFNYVCER